MFTDCMITHQGTDPQIEIAALSDRIYVLEGLVQVLMDAAETISRPERQPQPEGAL